MALARARLEEYKKRRKQVKESIIEFALYFYQDLVAEDGLLSVHSLTVDGASCIIALRCSEDKTK